jgi:hypothetical protein
MRLSIVRVLVTFVALFALLAVPLVAIVPLDSGTPSVVLPVTINVSSGDQYDPHVSGDLVSYTASDKIRYYDFFTGTDTQVPSPTGATDLLSDVNNGRIVFTRVQTSGYIPVFLYDVAAGTTTEIDPPGAYRFGAAIGGNTVAFIDLNASAEGELFISQLGGATVRVTNDARTDQGPQVAPLGNLVVYESCGTNCDIRQAAWNGTSWVVTGLTNTTDDEHNPDTDGTLVVYDANRAGDKNICWQPVGGGGEQCLELPGEQRNPSTSGGLIAFESITAGTAADLFVYHVATNRLFRITSTPADDSLSDVSALQNGQFRLAWSSGDVGDRDVYGATIELPPVSTFNFGGFLQPVDPYPTLNVMKAGAAVPIRFSLGGFQGLNIFAAGYPKSQIINCSSTASQDDIEQTTTAGGSSLTYDASTDQYSYIWKTDKTWAGTCRQLVIRLSDNTDRFANFKFK